MAIEDSDVGIRAALAAGLAVIAIPNRAFPPDPAVLARAHPVLESISELDPDAVLSAASGSPA